MPRISQSETEELISKLLAERIPVRAHLKSSSGAEANISGFVDSKTSVGTVTVSSSGPPIKVEEGFLVFRPFDRPCEVWYGEKRELPEALKPVADKLGQSALVFDFPSFDERLALFFTI